MPKIKVLAVVPYIGLGEILNDIISKYPDIDLAVVDGNLSLGVEAAREALNKDSYDIIISRGGTSERLAKEFWLPVVNIDVSGYDFLRVFKLVTGFNEKAAVVGFSSITRGAQVICDILHSDIRVVTVTRENEVESMISRLYDQGFSVIIGDVIAIDAAKRVGVNGILLTSGEESIEKALSDVRWVHSLIGESSRDLAVLKSITDNDRHFISAYDRDGNIIYTNADKNEESESAPYLRKFIPDVLGNGKFETTINDFSCMWRIRGQMVKDINGRRYAIFYFHKHKIVNDDTPHGINFISPEAISSSPFIPLSGENEIRNICDRAKQIANTDMRVLMVGEKGTGIDSLAYLIHLNSKKSNKPFVTVDCDILAEEDFDHICSHARQYMEEYDGATIFFKSINVLDVHKQRRLYAFLSEHEIERAYRIIASSDVSLSLLVKTGEFVLALYRYLSSVEIFMPSLYQRKGDIPILAGLYINNANTQFGKQVSGFEKGVIELLKEFDWQFNITDLKKVIDQLVLSAQGPYITQDKTIEILNSYKDVQSAGRYILPKNKKFDDICREIIQQVLTEEGFNQSKAAKRLGISRSTLWRKMNNMEDM